MNRYEVLERRFIFKKFDGIFPHKLVGDQGQLLVAVDGIVVFDCNYLLNKTLTQCQLR